MEEAIYSFKLAGFILLGIIVVPLLLGSLLRVVPFSGAIMSFGFVLFLLHVILGSHYWIDASHFSEDTKLDLKYAVFGVILFLLIVLVVWAKVSD